MPGSRFTMISPVVTSRFSSTPRSTRFSSRNPRSWLAANEPSSSTRRRSGSAPASEVLNSDSWLAKVRIELSEASWPLSTMLLSSISFVVTSKFSSAVRRKELPLSMIVWRSSPLPANALPNSSTVVRRASRSTDSTRFERLVSRTSVWIGVSVISTGISPSSPK